jgi:hypothetical protein
MSLWFISIHSLSYDIALQAKTKPPEINARIHYIVLGYTQFNIARNMSSISHIMKMDNMLLWHISYTQTSSKNIKC